MTTNQLETEKTTLKLEGMSCAGCANAIQKAISHVSGVVVAKQKRKLTAAEKRAKKERQKKYESIFINGKQVRVRRPETIEGLPVDEFIARNADRIWLHQNGMWEYLHSTEDDLPDSSSSDDVILF
jgi:copper chaperone CopZ